MAWMPLEAGLAAYGLGMALLLAANIQLRRLRWPQDPAKVGQVAARRKPWRWALPAGFVLAAGGLVGSGLL